MFRSRFYTCCALAAFGLSFCSSVSALVNDEARKALGQGIHLLYAGRVGEALASFDAASGPLQNDPRLFYMRGIAKRRLGQVEEAAADFRRGAQLEAALGRSDVGRALERFQGAERLTIERYRREGRRLARVQRVRPGAQSETLPDPRSAPRPRQLAVSELPGLDNLPEDPNDPFASTTEGVLGRGTIYAPIKETTDSVAATSSEAEIDDGLDDEPFGSGFDETSAEDPFSNDLTDDAGFGEDPPPTEVVTEKKSRGMLGSVLRAVTKGSLPTEQGKNIMQGLRQAIPGQGEGSSTTIQRTVEEPAADEPAGDDSMPADDDPFANDPFAEPAADDTTGEDPLANDNADDDPFADEGADDNADDSDPFADEEDPFADDQ